MMKNTVREGNLFQVVDCSLTACFSSSLLPSLNTLGVARAGGYWGILRIRLTVPPDGDGEEESHSASGQLGAPGDQRHYFPSAARQRRGV